MQASRLIREESGKNMRCPIVILKDSSLSMMSLVMRWENDPSRHWAEAIKNDLGEDGYRQGIRR